MTSQFAKASSRSLTGIRSASRSLSACCENTYLPSATNRRMVSASTPHLTANPTDSRPTFTIARSISRVNNSTPEDAYGALIPAFFPTRESTIGLYLRSSAPGPGHRPLSGNVLPESSQWQLASLPGRDGLLPDWQGNRRPPAHSQEPLPASLPEAMPGVRDLMGPWVSPDRSINEKTHRVAVRFFGRRSGVRDYDNFGSSMMVGVKKMMSSMRWSGPTLLLLKSAPRKGATIPRLRRSR